MPSPPGAILLMFQSVESIKEAEFAWILAQRKRRNETILHRCYLIDMNN